MGKFGKFESTESDKFFFNLGLRGNVTVQDVAFRMMSNLCQLEELFPEYNGRINKVSQAMNAVFFSFRQDFRTLVGMTEAHMQRNTNQSDKDIVKHCHQTLSQTYGSYDLREICHYGHEYYNMLVRRGVMPIVAGWEETTAEARFNKF
jgi:hypothetical protein